jgi:hypothetical protein
MAREKGQQTRNSDTEAHWLTALETAQSTLAAAAYSVPRPEDDSKIHALYYHAGQTIKEAIAAARKEGQ